MDYEYVIGAGNDVDRDVSPLTSNDEATAFADDPLVDTRVDSSIRKGNGKGTGTRVN